VEPAVPIDPQSVFLNVPFDRRYRPLFIALIAGLTALGRKPHCVLEVPSSGRNRLDRIFGLIGSCAASIHDLSRVSLSRHGRVPRFNMPFELGIAYSLSRRTEHSFFVFEEKPFRLQTSLSDLNGHDPHIHEGKQSAMLRCILDCFVTLEGTPPFETVKSITRRLSVVTTRLERGLAVDHPFHPAVFRQIVDAAVELAEVEGLSRDVGR
jgi:hypothetical protein